MADTSTVTLTPQQELVDLINQDNNSSLTLADIMLSDPSPVVFSGRNTKVTVTAKAGSHYANSKDVYYNRLALSGLGYIGIMTDSTIDNATLLSMISSQKQIQLLIDEFLPFAIPVIEVGSVAKVTLVAKATAIKWLGQVDVNLAFSLPAGLDILDQLINVTLPGRHYLG